MKIAQRMFYEYWWSTGYSVFQYYLPVTNFIKYPVFQCLIMKFTKLKINLLPVFSLIFFIYKTHFSSIAIVIVQASLIN